MDRRIVIPVGLTVAAVVALVAGRAILAPGDVEAEAPVQVPTRDGCSSLMVAASSEKAQLMQTMATDYNAASRGTAPNCVTVTVESAASGDVEAALVNGWDESVASASVSRPDVWTPAADTWLNLLRYDQSLADKPTVLADENASLTSTPLVLAMPQPMAEALGWPDKEIGWTDVLALVNDPNGWGSYGHPEWGQFTLGKTNPYISTSGLAATVGQLVAATGKPADLTSADVENPEVRVQLAALENSVVHYGDTTLTFLNNLLIADERGRALSYISAVAVEEKSVVDYNAGNPSGAANATGTPPTVPLVAIHPKEGTLYSNSPYAVLNADWVTEEQKVGAADFFAYLTEPEQQERFASAGFRTDPAQPADSLLQAGTAVALAQPGILNTPSPQVLAEARSAWDEQRKRARVLIEMDQSGSMDEPANGVSGVSKMELAKQAAIDSLTQLKDTDEVGLWGFTTELDDNLPYRELVPVAPLSENRDQLIAAIGAMQPLNGTPLYSATRFAFDEMRSQSDPDFITGVVLLTDGKSDGENDSLESLLDGGNGKSGLRDAAQESDVRIFTVAYGSGADVEGLKAIADATQAKSYDATEATNIGRVFKNILSNF